MNVVIGVDAHKASHTAVAIDEAEDELSSVKVRATGRQVDQLMELGRAVREAHVGERVSQRPGLLVSSAAGGSGRGSARCAGHLGLSHPGARHRALQQERPRRCSLGRNSCLSGPKPAQRRGG